MNIQKINAYLTSLREQERSAATIQKYGHDLRTFLDFAGKMPFSKITVIAWKEQLMASYAPATVNSMLAAINGYLRFFGWGELRLVFLHGKLRRVLKQCAQKQKKTAGAVFTTRTGKELDIYEADLWLLLLRNGASDSLRGNYQNLRKY